MIRRTPEATTMREILDYESVSGLVTSHCELDGQLRPVHRLEAYAPAPATVGLRCRRGHGCRLNEGAPPVELTEDRDGRVLLTEQPPPVDWGYHYRVKITPNGNPVRVTEEEHLPDAAGQIFPPARTGPMARMRHELTRLHNAARGLTGGHQ